MPLAQLSVKVQRATRRAKGGLKPRPNTDGDLNPRQLAMLLGVHDAGEHCGANGTAGGAQKTGTSQPQVPRRRPRRRVTPSLASATPLRQRRHRARAAFNGFLMPQDTAPGKPSLVRPLRCNRLVAHAESEVAGVPAAEARSIVARSSSKPPGERIRSGRVDLCRG